MKSWLKLTRSKLKKKMQKRNRKKLKWNSSQNISWFELEGGGRMGTSCWVFIAVYVPTMEKISLPT